MFLRLFRRLFGKVYVRGFQCMCGGILPEAKAKDRNGELVLIDCPCGNRWQFEWVLTHFNTRCWFPLRSDSAPDINVQTPEAAAEFVRKRDAGVFGPRNEAEYQESLRLADELEREQDEWNEGVHDL